MSHSDYAWANLNQIEAMLQNGEPLGLSAKEYLLEVIKRARRGDKDPLGIHNNGSSATESKRREAVLEVYRRKNFEPAKSLSEIQNDVGDAIYKTGGDGGYVDKAYKEFSADLVSADLIYTARREQRALSADESARLKANIEKSAKKAKARNSQKVKGEK